MNDMTSAEAATARAAITYRGAVQVWQCDHMGHMNVMWYVGKFDEGTWNFFASLGITGGCATGPLRYCPSDPVTRAQMATFIERAFPFVYGLSPAEVCSP